MADTPPTLDVAYSKLTKAETRRVIALEIARRAMGDQQYVDPEALVLMADVIYDYIEKGRK